MSTTTWTIDPTHSQIGFAVKHMMFAKVRGRFGSVEGEIVADPGSPGDATVEVRIDAASIDTNVEDRDEHLRSEDFLAVSSYPDITFRSTRVEGRPFEDDSFRLVGDLTIRGTTREVTLEATHEGTGEDPWGNTRAGFSAETTIDRRDFGLTWNQALEKGGILVGHDVDIRLEVQATAQVEAGVAAG